ncbi:MAG: hypothetical protein ACWGQW_03330 [bacterium]
MSCKKSCQGCTCNQVYSVEEQTQILEWMREVSTWYYNAACHIGNHAFIEFTGLMNEYIKVCEQTMEDGVDFTRCNQHGGEKLKVHGYNISYLKEKLECIFGTTLDVQLVALPGVDEDEEEQ